MKDGTLRTRRQISVMKASDSFSRDVSSQALHKTKKQAVLSRGFQKLY